MYKVTSGISLYLAILSSLLFIWSVLAASWFLIIFFLLVGFAASINFVDDLVKALEK